MNRIKKTSPVISEVADKMRRIHAVDHLNSFALMRTGGTLLHVAARQDQEDVARALLQDYGFNVNARDTWGRTPLLWALKRKQFGVTKFLLAAGADMFVLDHQRQNALHVLFEDHSLLDFYELFLGELAKKCAGSSEEMARILIDAGCDVYQASYSRNARVIEYMIERGLRIDAAHPEYRTTALHTAIVFEDVDSMRVLLKHGFDASALDAEGLNFLCYVYRYCLYHTKEKIVSLQILLQLGIPSTSLTPDGEFQIWPSLVAGSAEAVRVILQSSIDYKAKDSKRRTLLHYLAKNRNPRVFEEVKLHVAKLDVNEVDESGSSPLHVAVAYSNPEMVEFLLDQGARVNCVEYAERCTPLYYALTESIPGSENHDDRCVELLLQRGADPQLTAVEQHGQPITIFDIAVRHGTYRRIKFTVAHLAILEGLGTAISDVIRSRIDSRRVFSEYFGRCRWLLRQNVSDSSTSLLKLLTANKHKMAKYLGNRHLVMKLKRISYKRKLRASFPYYWSALAKRFRRGMRRRILKNKVAPVISRIFGGCLDKTDLIVDKTIEHLNDHDLQQLCQQREEIV